MDTFVHANYNQPRLVHLGLSVHTAADGSDGQPDAYYREDDDCAQPSSIEPAPIVAADWVHTYFAKLVAC